MSAPADDHYHTMNTSTSAPNSGASEIGDTITHVYNDVYQFVDHVDDFVDREIEEAKKKSRTFRRNWVPVIKNVLSSAADIIGDWVFYFRTKNGAVALDEFEAPIYFFCIVSSVLGALAIFSLIMNTFSCFSKTGNESKFKKQCTNRIKWVLGFEMFFEDIPQVVLTYLVLHTKNGGVWSPVGVFNITTSAFNFTFNILDMLMPLAEVHHEVEEKVE